ncbi:helix-turn-helix protein [Tumebacillus sp. BK434]|uniref:AraC family transcriptional regulator n=1 Tax=Tumebacillus sp. BK434 TaxID=2512169 RepID=UPI00104C8F2D|nr:AraC family transcriptional regulator [Tumebacillus sp. BK434]TCP59309.1 helix-turn-helix protein [Tumebacillus sp. BK434]
MPYLKFELPNSKIRILHLDPMKSDVLHTHHDEYQISIPLAGAPFVEMNRSEVVHITHYQRLVTMPETTHRHYTERQPAKLLLLDVKEKFLQKVLRERLHCEPGPIEFDPVGEGSSDGFRKIADGLLRQSMLGETDALQLAEWELELVNLLLSLHPGSHHNLWLSSVPGEMHPALQKVLEYIHDTYAEEVCLDYLADISGISKFHLIRLFRETIGQTPSQYVNEVRLTRAVEMLTATDREVTDVALDAGFGSLSTFHRAFKKKYGISAGQYRKIR